MRRYNDDKKDKRHQHRGRRYEIGRREREMFSQHTARENADAETQVPCGEIGGCGGATLHIGAQVDEQGVERWECRTKAQTTA